MRTTNDMQTKNDTQTTNDQGRPHSQEHNKSMTDRDRQKTVANPSPGSADPGNEGSDRARPESGMRRH